MILIVSGEGPTDIGRSKTGRGECGGDDFEPGPMAVLIEKLADAKAGFDFAAASMEFVSEARRLEIARQEFSGKFFRGKKRRDYEEGYYFNEARALAFLAKRKATEAKCRVAPILFRDSDSNDRAGYDIVRKSIRDGFNAEDLEELGVAMVPKPTSEAWLICALQAAPYQNCAALEETLSGSGAGKRPAKGILKQLLDARGKTLSDLHDLINQGEISAGHIRMPSYDDFREDLERAVTRLMDNAASQN